jgi:hypothetical protein
MWIATEKGFFSIVEDQKTGEIFESCIGFWRKIKI